MNLLYFRNNFGDSLIDVLYKKSLLNIENVANFNII